ncbi:MAG: hypothetical protein DLM67_22380 [Candidatus Nephthysia bennettiae]|uniref:glycosyltransferase family 2 protein n=1 Tax=Candidatus Nephthysia bennettiae TaxID=3127016 RepID=UPI000DB441AF|nr:MAG: hypothetical protein DLM67_22380 [Candidatus Dormibacteraeota bacterium]
MPWREGSAADSQWAASPRLSVIVPTRNEAGSLRRLKQELEAALSAVSHEVIVVDDSTDLETRPLLRELASHGDGWRAVERPPVRQTGLATAVTEGLAAATGECVCVMDADLQHPPALVTELLKAVEEGTDVAVASRYTTGGVREGLVTVYRHLVSGGTRVAAHLLFPESRRTADPLSGFFCLRRRAVTGRVFKPIGFKILLEILVVCPELRVTDVPFVFGRRAAGESKASAKEGLLYLAHLASLFIRVPQSSARLKLSLIAACCLGGFIVTFDVLRWTVAPVTLAWLLASASALLVNGALQQAVQLWRGGAIGLVTLGLGAAAIGALLYSELLRVEPANPVGTGVVVQGAVLTLSLCVALVSAGRATAGRRSHIFHPETASASTLPGSVKQLRTMLPQGEGPITCSVGIMAHNEEANIGHTLRAILAQDAPSLRIEEFIVVASGCTDGTLDVVADVAREDPRIRVCVQEKREGKASAVNLFLKHASSPVVVMSAADVIPDASALARLCAPFQDPKVGMVGGRPVPVNDPYTFMGHVVHLLWRLHDHVARDQPKLGEVVAFRNVISGIPADTAVDEISIQALISQLGYRLLYEPGCVVYNKGPVTVHDFVKQRRRIYAGHLQVRRQQKYDAPTMRVTPIVRRLFDCRHFALSSPRRLLWTLGAVLLEGLARIQGYSDYRRKHGHSVWQMVESTKDLEVDPRTRRVSTELSVLIFRLIVPGSETYDDVYPESGDRQATEAARQLLATIRCRIRKEDRLSTNGAGIVTLVARVGLREAELIAQDIQETVQATPVQLGRRGRRVRVTVAYSVLALGPRTKKTGVAAAGSPAREALGTAGTD